MSVVSVLGLLGIIGVAKGAILYNSQNNVFGTGNDVTYSYRIAYEIYNNLTGISTVAGRGVIIIELNQNLNAGDTANLVIPQYAEFNSAGPNYKYGLCNIGANNTCDPDEIIGFVPAAGVTTNNLGFTIIGNVTAGTRLQVVQWEDNVVNNNQYDAGEDLIPGAGLYVHGGLNASCTFRPIIRIGFTTPHETSPIYNFAYITPQFASEGPESDILNAELDSDADFSTFILGSGDNVINGTMIDTGLTAEYLFRVTDQANNMWIAFANVNPQGNIQFDLNSAVVEPDVTSINLDASACTTTDHRTWSCQVNNTPILGDHEIRLVVSGTTVNNPTVWTISNFSMQLVTAGLNPLCINIPPSGIGIWWGGLEAIVPFVKYDPAVGAQTYIVFYNRRDVDVPVYARALLQDPNPIVISQNQIATIPAHGRIVFTADQLQSLLPELAGYNMANGVPIKFMFRVPTQSLKIDYPIINNPYDPYIDGIVVSIYGSEQRTVPLKFKFFKQGSYNE